MRFRRRPIATAAVVGGVAHHAAKSGAEAAAAEGQQQEAPPAPAPAEGGMSSDEMEQLKQLAQLHEQGVLTDEEFAAQKAKVLGG